MPISTLDSVRPGTPRIDYAPPQPAWKRRTVKRSLATILLFSIASVVTWELGPPVLQRVTLMRAQRRCLDVRMPPKLVVFTNDQREGTALRYQRNSQYFQYFFVPGPAVCWYAPQWTEFIGLLEPPDRKPAA